MNKNKFCISKKIFLLFTTLIFSIFLILFSYLANKNKNIIQGKAAPSQLMSLKSQLLNGNLSEVILKSRHDLLIKQITDNKSDIFKSVDLLTENEINEIKKSKPNELENFQKQGLIEEYVSDIKGTYIVNHTDTFKAASKDINLIERVTGKKNSGRTTYQLSISNFNEDLQSNSPISFSKGIIFDDVIHTDKVTYKVSSQNSVLGTTSNLDYLVIPFYFKEQDPATFVPPFTKQSIEHELFDKNNPKSVVNFFTKGSYGKLAISGKVLDWIQIPLAGNTIYTNTKDCTYDLWSAEADKIVEKMDGFSAYKKIYIFPNKKTCKFFHYNTETNSYEWVGWAGRGEMNGSKVWLNGSNTSAVYLHEIGHNLNVPHAKALLCETKSIDSYDKCEIEEYGNSFDSMGNAYGYGQFNSVYKRNLGWLSNIYKSKEIVNDGEYSITNSDLIDDLSGPDDRTDKIKNKILRIKKTDTDEQYYIEFRSISSFELEENPKVLINLMHEGSTHLINPNPINKGEGSAYLDINESFYDQKNKILITVKDISSTQATISVKFGIDSFNHPAPTLTPTLTPTPLAVEDTVKIIIIQTKLNIPSLILRIYNLDDHDKIIDPINYQEFELLFTGNAQEKIIKIDENQDIGIELVNNSSSTELDNSDINISDRFSRKVIGLVTKKNSSLSSNFFKHEKNNDGKPIEYQYYFDISPNNKNPEYVKDTCKIDRNYCIGMNDKYCFRYPQIGIRGNECYYCDYGGIWKTMTNNLGCFPKSLSDPNLKF